MLSSPPKGSSRFTTLPARPPTPPRDTSKAAVFSPETNETVDEALRFLEEGHRDPPQPSSPSRVTCSIDTPPSKAVQPRGSTASKKVDFLLEPTFPVRPAPLSSPLRVSHESPAPRSSGPLKSILKRSIEQLPPTPDDVESRLNYFSPQEPGSFRKMLQSVLKQLAGPSRDGRRDAYLCLNGALKQYSDLPEREALVDKMNLLQQFLTRDMAWKDSQGALDAQIVTQALNLTSALLWEATTEAALDDDFRAFVVDRSIVILEQSDAPKPVVKAHVHILMMQHFPSSIMTANKVERLLASLQTIEERCTGNSVVSARLTVYQKLATQQPSVMLSRMPDWIGHVLAGLLSTINDTRLRAIETCQYAAMRMGSYPLASKTLFELFDAETDEGIAYCDYFNKRLMDMASDKELAHFVPQIWAAVILFFRSKRKPLDRWPRLRGFLATIQRCLNSGDMTVKHHAHIAWNKLMFAVLPDASTTSAMRSMLRLPIMTLLDRRGNDKFSQQAKELALHSYCHLLNYGLRPTLSHEEMDASWKLYVEEVIPKLVKAGRRGQAQACRLLHGLLQRKKPNYNEHAAIELNPLKPEDLPSLDAKWVRSRLGRIIQVLEPILAAGMVSPPDANEASNSCWRSLFQTVAEAGTQEVKTSNELKIALAELTNFFRRLWLAPKASSRTSSEASLWLDRYQLLLDTCVESLGASPFVEDFLAKTNADEVEATPTPSNRTSKHQKTAYSPFVFLFALYYQPAEPLAAGEAYAQSAAWYLNLLAGARGSASGTIGLLHRTLQFCADQHSYASHGEELWAVVADAAVKALEKQTSASLQHNSQTVGIALRSSLNILMFALRTYPSSSLCSQKATELYAATCNFAKHYGGDGGVALGVIEPLAKSLLDMHEDLSVSAGLEICKSILESAVWPKSRQELEQGRKALWSISLDPPSKMSTALFDPYDHLYNLIGNISQEAYKELAKQEGIIYVSAIVDYFAAAVQFLLRCPAKIVPSSLKRMQETVAVFAGDRERALFPLSAPEVLDGTRQATTQLCSLWSDVLRFVQHSALPTDSVLLETLEPLLVAGLSSPSKAIVNKTITFWNDSFGAQDILEYPAKLLPVLRARRMQAEIQLPGLGDDESNGEIVELPAFADSRSGSPSMQMSDHRSPRPTLKPSNLFLNSPFGTPGLSATVSATKKGTKSSRRSTPRARLRHDDSQLEFAPIESSPSRSAVQESQMLTEHQKEVKARQHGDAQMFPELSSSPGRSASKSKSINKKLDFSSDAARDNGSEALATPTALADNNPMSDDMPSSPTPRASGRAPEADQMSDDEATDIIDPPSSPPRRAEDLEDEEVEHLDETMIVTESNADQNAAISEARNSNDQNSELVAAQNETQGVVPSDMVSDDFLPTAQLEREAAAAGTGEGPELDEVEEEEKFFSPAQAPHDVNETEDHNSQTPSRIEESFFEQNEHINSPSAVDSIAATPRGSRSRRNKRQRAADATDSPRKKAKKATPSPIKELWRRLTSSPSTPHEDEDEEDIGEEIVVATRPRPSLNSQQSQLLPVPEPITEVETVTDSQEQQHIKRQRGRPRKSYSSQQSQPEPEQEPVVQSQPESQPKRGRGRPRKNAIPQVESSQPTTSAPSTSRKRRASLISNADLGSNSTSIVADTPAPAPPTTRKAARLSQGATDAGSSLREAQTQEDEQAGSVSPKNILARLYGVLADIPKMVFGGQEDERAFDDVLFEMRRSVHEVARKARE